MSIHDDYDELASAYLDGEATAEEIARVESDPELLAIVDEFRTIAQAVAAPISLPDERTRNAAIAAAVSAPGAIPTTPSVRSLDTARPKRRERMNKLMSVAAGFVAVVVGGTIIWAIANAGDERTTDTATSSVQASSDASDAVSDTAADEAAFDSIFDDAMEEEPLEEAALEEAEDDAMEDEPLVDSARAAGAGSDEQRLGDDDAADEPATVTQETQSSDASDGEASDAANADETADQAGPISLADLLSQTRRDLGDSESGLFPVPIAERTDYRGSFATTDDLLAAASDLDPTVGDASPLDAADCEQVASRLMLAPNLLFVGTAHVVDQVTGADVPLALVQIGDNAALLAISLDDCVLYLGQDDLP